LNGLQNYIVSNQADFAEKYLAKFSKLMQASLEYSDLEIISLESELEFLKDYLLINQKLRFGDSMQYQVTVDEDLEEDIIGVPTMIVQPYVENAIEHGLRPNKGGLITIEFKYYDEDTILCIVQDDGVGREFTREQQKKDGYELRHKSRGTSITEKRLELLNSTKKDKFFVQIIDLKDPLSKKPLGTRVEIKIPIVELPFKNQDD
jgi:sensor histidine kinase YesM